MRRPTLSSCALAVVALGSSACVERGQAQVLLPFVDAAGVQGLVGVRARLTLTDAEGRHPAVRLRVDGAAGTGVEAVDVPLPCDDAACRGTLDVDPGSYAVELTLSALDRCAVRGDVLRFAGTVTVGHWDGVEVALVPDDASFDADADGVIDVLEASGCGRFDVDEGAAPPRLCGPGRDACCPETSVVVGGQMAFAGGTVTLPYDRDGVAGNDVATVGPFVLDSTEFTQGAFARCVAAGACLPGQPDHPVRLQLEFGLDPLVPVRGLSPAEANEACAWAGRRLPTDAEWYAAAALRAAAPPATYPFDVEEGAPVGCLPDDPPPAAAHRAAGRACGDGEPFPVGSFLQTVVDRGTGTPVADLAGNVAEWTVIEDASGVGVTGEDLDDDGVPDGAIAIALRGGGSTSFLQLLENDLVVIFDVADIADLARLGAATPVAGFRCASDDVIVVDEEPVCPAPAPDAAADTDAAGETGGVPGPSPGR